MDLSVIVCTYDRPDRLERTLRELLDQSMADDAHEIVVVYDSRVPETRRVVGRFDDERESVRAVAENERAPPAFTRRNPADGQRGTPGLSHARNVGVEVADSEYVHFVDDDASPASETVVESVHRTFLDVDPSPVCVGGRVEPEFERPVPPWLAPSVSDIPICRLGDAPHWVSFPEEVPIGANLAFEREFLVDAGGFPESLGRKQGRLLGGEEMVLVARAARTGGVYYQPEATVVHHLPANRLTTRYNVRSSFWSGVSRRRAEALGVYWGSADVPTDAASLGRRVLGESAALCSALARRDRQRFVTGALRAVDFLGYVFEAAQGRLGGER